MSGDLQKQHQQILRTLMRSPCNKKCADCGDQCPVNVDTTHGIFICTNCSGIHREFCDRIESVSNHTFTQDEIDLLQIQTNEDFNRVWMFKWKQGEMPLPLNADDNHRRHFLQAKYVERRWYSKSAQAQQKVSNQQNQPDKLKSNKQIQSPNPFNSPPQQPQTGSNQQTSQQQQNHSDPFAAFDPFEPQNNNNSSPQQPHIGSNQQTSQQQHNHSDPYGLHSFYNSPNQSGSNQQPSQNFPYAPIQQPQMPLYH